MTPTQAQIEAARKLLRNSSCFSDEVCSLLPCKCIEAALAAAAGVGEQTKDDWLRRESDLIAQIERATIERCAQVARNELEECQRCGDCEDDITMGQIGAASRILAGIEALKDKPVDMKCGGNHRIEAIKTLTAAAWPDPTPEMLASPQFEAIWQCIKRWDINVPDAYSGYCGANGNHVRAILDALTAAVGGQQTAGKDATVRRLMDEIERLRAELEIQRASQVSAVNQMLAAEQREAATIERCAQALEPLMQEIFGEGDDYAMGGNDTVRQGQAAIRALKDQDVK